MNQIKTAAVYIRVSTDMQLEQSPESQLIEIQRYAANHNILIQKEYIFMEQEGRSGRKAGNRVQFQNMIAMAKTTPKPFDCILVWKFSRFARNQDESTFYKSMLRKKLGIDVISVSEPIMDGMYGRLIEMIIEWQDEFYSYNLGVEVRRSMSVRAQKGYYNGKVPLGYTKDPGQIPQINESEAHIVRTIFQMYTSGRDKNYITRYLNDKGFRTKTGKVFDTDAVTYILGNPFYIGKIRWNRRVSSSGSSHALKDESEWIIADSHHTPIIDPEMFEAAQERSKAVLASHEKYNHSVSHGKHWLSGLVKCSICGKSLSIKIGKCNHFQCLGYNRGLHRESQSISERKLTAAVLESLRSVTSSGSAAFSLIRTQDSDTATEQMIYETELKDITNKEKRVREAYMAGVDTLEEYKANKMILDNRKNELISLLENLKTENLSPEDYQKQFLSTVTSVIDILESDADYCVKGEALRGIIQKIVFCKETQTLEFHYFLSI